MACYNLLVTAICIGNRMNASAFCDLWARVQVMFDSFQIVQYYLHTKQNILFLISLRADVSYFLCFTFLFRVKQRK